MKRSLYIDTVPQTAWHSNLRHILPPGEWGNIARQVYQNSGYLCEICGCKGQQHPVEAHERWLFDPLNQIQVLAAIEALCPPCHESTHFGLAQVKGNHERASRHLQRVNNWSSEQLDTHIEKAAFEYRNLSRISRWHLDISLLNQIADLVHSDSIAIINDNLQLARMRTVDFWKEAVLAHSLKLLP